MNVYYNFNYLEPSVANQLARQRDILRKRKNQIKFWNNFNQELLSKIIKIKQL
jgi:hypothetical protein